ncbi:heme ABC transporter permease [Thalassotalea ponticola]|uniref:heme ABC transporter permease n=1 Tax=Thalassotalea ponticola TaxID=1523392 RepID=UPI0025B412C1|nr:heme ABC transporter permease [Thalassotalea ponticola]MDN3653632.1 heme ABC transporter permease [Thalassotalea ponticola]
MWKWLHPLANPQTSYHLCGKLIPWFCALTFILLGIGMALGLVFSPADYQQGESVRIFYVHVPAALLSMGLYLGMAIAALCGLVWQYRLAQASIAALAPIGAVFTAIALFTGAAWGKPMWGTWWVWDARLTSELILLFLYFGVIALYNAFDDKSLGGKAASVLALVGVVNLPIIHYSVEWWNTLHQGATVSKFAKPSMSMDMYIPFVVCFFGFAFLAATLFCIRFRAQIIASNAMRPWVKELAMSAK